MRVIKVDGTLMAWADSALKKGYGHSVPENRLSASQRPLRSKSRTILVCNVIGVKTSLHALEILRWVKLKPIEFVTVT